MTLKQQMMELHEAIDPFVVDARLSLFLQRTVHESGRSPVPVGGTVVCYHVNECQVLPVVRPGVGGPRFCRLVLM